MFQQASLEGSETNMDLLTKGFEAVATRAINHKDKVVLLDICFTERALYSQSGTTAMHWAALRRKGNMLASLIRRGGNTKALTNVCQL
jgi:hypothetical protein